MEIEHSSATSPAKPVAAAPVVDDDDDGEAKLLQKLSKRGGAQREASPLL